MVAPSPLLTTLAKSLEVRHKRNMVVIDMIEPAPSAAPDFFSNDYLSLMEDLEAREIFMKKLAAAPNVFGSGGSRLLTGNSIEHVALETRLRDFFGAPSALLLNSGYDSNIAFWHSVPQEHDVIVADELVHASSRDGIAQSRAKDRLYLFSHNNVESLRECIIRALKEHPLIPAGKATLFVAAESVYSMDGDFAPLRDIVRVTHELVPKQCSHIMIDEAHSTGIFGPEGKGLVIGLGLDKQINTVLHTFGKGRASAGAVLLTDPIVRKFVINYGRPVIYTTGIPAFTVCNLEASFDYIGSKKGDELRARLRHIADYFHTVLEETFKHIPPNVLSLRQRNIPADFPASVFAPIFPILTDQPMELAKYLIQHGYAATAIPYPVVPKGEERVRVVVHAGNTQEQIDDLVRHMTSWASSVIQQGKQKPAQTPQIQARL